MKNFASQDAPPLLGETNLRFILGLKLNQYRRRNELSLKDLSEKSGLSVSYLNEIEKGKKYPKADKALALSQALGIGYDELVSLNLDGNLSNLNSLLKTNFLQKFPMEAFGITISGLMEMMAANPEKFSNLVNTFTTLGRRYDLSLEHLHYAALRSYVEMNYNYSEEIEEKVDEFTRKFSWPVIPVPDIDDLRRFLTRHWRYLIDDETLARDEELRLIKSVYLNGRRPKILLNSALNERHRVYLLCRELGYRYLGLKERVATSPSMQADSIQKVFNHYHASYFARALLLNRDHLLDDLMNFFRLEHLDGTRLLDLIQKYKVTPGLFLYRLSQLLPKYFGLHCIYYLRFSHAPGTDTFALTRELHFGDAHDAHASGSSEHFCRRWMALRLLKRFSGVGAGEPIIGIQRMRFIDTKREYLTISVAQNLFDRSNEQDSGVTLGILVNDHLRQVMRFIDDPSIPHITVNDTCERCRITDCGDRAASPSIYFEKQKQTRRIAALEKLLNES